MKTFPVMAHYDGAVRCFLPMQIPWDMIAPHEKQARANHCGQTLERLAQRGGLSRVEAVAVLEDTPWRQMKIEDADARLRVLLELFRSSLCS